MDQRPFEGDVPKYDEKRGAFACPPSPCWPARVILGVFGEPPPVSPGTAFPPGSVSGGIAEWATGGPIYVPSGWTSASYDEPATLGGSMFERPGYRTDGDASIVVEFDPGSGPDALENTFVAAYLDGKKEVALKRAGVCHETYAALYELPRGVERDLAAVTGIGMSVCGKGRVHRVSASGLWFGRAPSIVFLVAGELDAFYGYDAPGTGTGTGTGPPPGPNPALTVWDDDEGAWKDDPERFKGYAASFAGLISRRYPGVIVGIVPGGTDVDRAVASSKRALRRSSAGGLAGVLWQQGHVELDSTEDMQHAYERDLYDKVWRIRSETEIASWFTPFVAAPAPWLAFESFGQMHSLDRDMDPATAAAEGGGGKATAANGFGSAMDIAKRFYVAWGKVVRGLSC